MFFRALSAFTFVVALSPFAFAIACGSPRPAEATPPIASASASAPASASASASSPASASAFPHVEATAELVLVEGPCKEMNDANRFLRAHRACASDAECEVVMPTCACAVGVQKSVADEAKRRHDAAFSSCGKKAPMPCATCGPAPAPRCAAGLCRP